jgi:organic radical activating enzyme
MTNIFKCPALKHGVAVTSISDKFFYGFVQPCCQSANCGASQSPRNLLEDKTAIQTFYDEEVLIPVGRPSNASDDYAKYGIDSFDDIFKEHREWVNDDGYVDETVCSWCIDRANESIPSQLSHDENAKFGVRLSHTEYTPLDEDNIPIQHILDTEPKQLIFLGPLLLESICNFSCYICGSGNSTQWASIAKPIKKDLESANLSDDNSHIDKWYNFDHLDLNKNYTKKIKSVLYNTDLSSVKFVTLVGGEPLYGKMFLWFLELLDSKTDLSNIMLSFNTNVSIFPNEKILNILRKFKEIKVSLSIDGIGKLQETTRPGVSWEETNANIEKWVAFRNTTYKNDLSLGDDIHRITLIIGTTLSVLNVNKIGSILDYAIEKKICTEDLYILNPLIITLVQFKPYLDINLIPIKIRKNWLLDENNYPNIYHDIIEEYNRTILTDTPSVGGVDKCLAYLSIVEKATNTKYSDANPEIFECLQQLNEQTSP